MSINSIGFGFDRFFSVGDLVGLFGSSTVKSTLSSRSTRRTSPSCKVGFPLSRCEIYRCETCKRLAKVRLGEAKRFATVTHKRAYVFGTIDDHDDIHNRSIIINRYD